MGTGQDVYERIQTDMIAIWGDVATFMLKKRVQDVQADPANLSAGDLERIVQLLREKTLPSILGPEGAKAKADLYLRWIRKLGSNSE
jgi:hypothetical protein